MGYLYRAVDKDGKTVDSLFQVGRGIAAAMAFFRRALASCAPRWPRKITLDGHTPSNSGLRRLRRADYRWKYVLVRKSRYLNNVVEQDHRAIKGRCAHARVQVLQDGGRDPGGLGARASDPQAPVQIWARLVEPLVAEEAVGESPCVRSAARVLLT